jgi:hypothetical protein
MRHAACPNAASIRLCSAQPTTWREGKSSHTARDSHPAAVHTSVISPPHRIRRRHIKRLRQEIRRDRITMAPVGDDRPPFPAPHGDSGRWQQPPRVVPSHGIPLGLEWLGHAPTPSTVARLGRHGLHPDHQGDLCPGDRDGGVSLPVGLTPAATPLPPLAQHGNRPWIWGLSPQGRLPFDSLATTPRAFCHMSRSIRSRFCASRRRWNAS